MGRLSLHVGNIVTRTESKAGEPRLDAMKGHVLQAVVLEPAAVRMRVIARPFGQFGYIPGEEFLIPRSYLITDYFTLRELNLVGVDVVDLERIHGALEAGGDYEVYELGVILFFEGKKNQIISDGATLGLNRLRGTYNHQFGFLLSRDSLQELEQAVYGEGIDRLWVGAFWANVNRVITQEIKLKRHE